MFLCWIIMHSVIYYIHNYISLIPNSLYSNYRNASLLFIQLRAKKHPQPIGGFNGSILIVPHHCSWGFNSRHKPNLHLMASSKFHPPLQASMPLGPPIRNTLLLVFSPPPQPRNAPVPETAIWQLASTLEQQHCVTSTGLRHVPVMFGIDC